MKHKLIFLFYTENHGEDPVKYGVKPMEQRGFEVEVWVLYPLVTGKTDQKRSQARLFTSWDDLARAMDQQDPRRTLMVDFFLALTALTWPGERVYRMLGARGLGYVAPSLAPMPISAPPDLEASAPSAWGRLWGKIRGQSLWRLRDMVTSRAIFALRRHTRLYPLPRAVFSLKNEALDYFCARTGYPPEAVRPIHSMEYDRYLAYQKAHPDGEEPTGTCVFLDEALTHHPDWFLLYGKGQTEGVETYYAKMKALFDAIEAQTGLKVVIAAHPRSDYESLGPVFGQREIVKGKTQELVARASLVLAHASTSVSFAALFGKPLLIVWVEGAFYLTRYLPWHLKTELLDLEQPGQLEAFDFAAFLERPLDYEDYIHHYLKSPDAPADKTCWELIGPQLEDL